MGMRSMGTAVSALMANKAALNTTAHNLTNVNTKGYVRQQVLMKESNNQLLFIGATNHNTVGLGTDVSVIRQVRDVFLDKSFRTENGRMNFYAAKAEALQEIEDILGELEGETFSDTLNDLFVSLNELTKHPDGLETRASLVQTASKFVERSNLVMRNIENYQRNVDYKIRDSIDRINEIGTQISELNLTISKAEMNGGNANDYRDQRNLLLDELGGLINIRYREEKDGTVLVTAENVPFVVEGRSYKMRMSDAPSYSEFSEPYWDHVSQKVFNFDTAVSTGNNNDLGYLKGLVMARGNRTTNYTDIETQAAYDDISHSEVMTAMATFDKLVHEIVTKINNVISPLTTGTPASLEPNAPYGLDGSRGTELFSRVYMDRFDGAGNYNEEDPAVLESLYHAGNIKINTEILNDYSKIPLSSYQDAQGDNSVVQEILASLNNEDITLAPGQTSTLKVRGFYAAFMSEVAAKGNLSRNEAKNGELMKTQIGNQREILTGVSSDEELSKMLQYQHAYNAASRLVSIVDSMLEKVVNSLGIIGR